MLTTHSHLSEGVKNTRMNFPYHTEIVSQHVDHLKPIKNFLKKCWKKLIIFHEGGVGGTPFAENSAKIINLIFEPFPNRVKISVYLCMCCHVKLVMSPDIA